MKQRFFAAFHFLSLLLQRWTQGWAMSIQSMPLAQWGTNLFLEHCSIYSNFFSRRNKVHGFTKFQKTAVATGKTELFWRKVLGQVKPMIENNILQTVIVMTTRRELKWWKTCIGTIKSCEVAARGQGGGAMGRRHLMGIEFQLRRMKSFRDWVNQQCEST